MDSNKRKGKMMCLSAVRGFTICRITITGYFTNTRKMSSNWASAKQKYLTMSTTEKQAFYKCGSNFKTVSDLPTWEEYAKDQREKGTLGVQINILGGFQINPSKNAELAKKISTFKGDITTLEVDAIVNAANNSLLGGGGVDGAIHRAAGPDLKNECRTLEGCKTGEAKMTGAYELPAKYVIHTVGPRKEKPDLLTVCYKNCLNIMRTEKLRTIAFPCISTGIYGYPLDKAAQVACKQVRVFLEENGAKVDRIIFCLFGDEDVSMYNGTLQSYFPFA